MREVIATKQQRLPGDLGQGVAVGVAEVETGRMAAAAAVVAIRLRGHAGLVGVDGFDLDSVSSYD